MSYTQEELLEEGFWDNFVNSKVGRLGATLGTAAKEVAKVVAPEITNPIGKVVDRLGDAKKKITSSALTKSKNAELYLRDAGFQILPKSKLVWGGRGSDIGVVDVGELGYNSKGPVVAKTYSNPRLIIKSLGNGDFKILKQPYRHSVKGVVDPGTLVK